MWPLATDQRLPGPTDVAAASSLPGLPPIVQAREAANLALFLETQPTDLILMGDLNGAPWGRVQRAFRAKTVLDNHAGWDFTWPSPLPWPLRLPLDHVLARGHLVVTEFDAGPEIDSDHFPVIAEIGWRD
jgi:endonuclease/exonuclease/phosphatase (EEP) superfamily protein YafD